MAIGVNITSVNTLGERLTYARELRGMSQQELAERASCTQGAIGNVESGERHSLRNLVAVARALRVSADWLYDGKGPKPVLGVAESEAIYPTTPPLAWPFTSIERGDLAAMAPDQLAEVEEFIRFKLTTRGASHQAAAATGTTGPPPHRRGR